MLPQVEGQANSPSTPEDWYKGQRVGRTRVKASDRCVPSEAHACGEKAVNRVAAVARRAWRRVGAQRHAVPGPLAAAPARWLGCRCCR